MYDLDHKPLRTVEVERPRAVAVGLRRRLQRHAVSLQIGPPGVDVRRGGDRNADVVQPAIARRLGAMEREVVAGPVEIDVVGIGAPLDGVAHDVDPEPLRRRQIADVERDVADAEQRRPGEIAHGCPPARATLAMNSTVLSGPLTWWLMISSSA